MASGSQQGTVANQAFVHLGVKLNTFVHQRVKGGELVSQQAGMVLLAPVWKVPRIAEPSRPPRF